jgi:hypothetical protein
MSTVRKVLSVCESGAPLLEWLTEARRGGRALLILGEQGAGRSAILRELQRARRRAGRHGRRDLVSRGRRRAAAPAPDAPAGEPRLRRGRTRRAPARRAGQVEPEPAGVASGVAPDLPPARTGAPTAHPAAHRRPAPRPREPAAHRASTGWSRCAWSLSGWQRPPPPRTRANSCASWSR